MNKGGMVAAGYMKGFDQSENQEMDAADPTGCNRASKALAAAIAERYQCRNLDRKYRSDACISQ